MLILSHNITFVAIECGECGINFCVTEQFHKRQKELGPNGGWYCPNGHSRVFKTSTKDQEIARLKEERDISERSQLELRNQLLNKTEQVNKLQKSIERRNKRLKAGVCPCCNRTFKELAEHMKIKHPDYAGELHKPKAIHKKINSK